MITGWLRVGKGALCWSLQLLGLDPVLQLQLLLLDYDAHLEHSGMMWVSDQVWRSTLLEPSAARPGLMAQAQTALASPPNTQGTGHTKPAQGLAACPLSSRLVS